MSCAIELELLVRVSYGVWLLRWDWSQFMEAAIIYTSTARKAWPYNFLENKSNWKGRAFHLLHRERIKRALKMMFLLMMSKKQLTVIKLMMWTWDGDWITSSSKSCPTPYWSRNLTATSSSRCQSRVSRPRTSTTWSRRTESVFTSRTGECLSAALRMCFRESASHPSEKLS